MSLHPPIVYECADGHQMSTPWDHKGLSRCQVFVKGKACPAELRRVTGGKRAANSGGASK